MGLYAGWWLNLGLSSSNLKMQQQLTLPNKKKKRTTTIFLIKISFLYENVNCHEIFISDQILLKLECDVDEYLYFPCVCTNYTKANGKRVLEALIQCYCLHGIPSTFYICKVGKRYVVIM